MLLKTKKHQLRIEIKARNVQRFEEETCEKDEETILSILPAKALGRGKFEFMAKLLNYFQKGFKKLPIESEDEDEFDENGELIKEKTFDCYDFIDEWCEDNEKSITDLYRIVIEEFDVKGIIDKGMGFRLSKMIGDSMQQMIEEMDSQVKEAIQQQE